MGRSHYSANKKRREADKARKKRDKEERRRRYNEVKGDESDIASVEEIQGAAMKVDPTLESIQVVAPRRATLIPARLFVGGLSRTTTENDLRLLFEPHGGVQDATVVMDRTTGESRGFGFVTMAGRKAAEVAIKELDGAEYEGRRLQVDRSKSR